MKAIILAGGLGEKIWPYGKYRNKTMIPIGNQPIAGHLVDNLKKAGIMDIVIGAVHGVQEIKHYFRKDHFVQVVALDNSRGTGDTLLQLKEHMGEECMVLFGDCLISEEDIRGLILSHGQVLVSQLMEPSINQICVGIDEDNHVQKFWGHPRGDFHDFACGFILKQDILSYIDSAKDIFGETKVGVGSPQELYLENALNDYVVDGHQLLCYRAQYPVYDIDKPWHIMMANHAYNQYDYQHMHQHCIGEDCQMSPNAKLGQNVQIGKRCIIGDYVVIGDGCVIDDDTRIDQGAVLEEGVHVGKKCVLENYCHVGSYSSIGDECIVAHTSEIIEAVLFEKVYLYHYGEYYGVIGTHSDLGAGTTCGTLRFDDGQTIHSIRGRREIPAHYANACFIGDYSRTGVGVLLLPGCKVGSKSVVGSGVVLKGELKDEMLVYPKQELCYVPWGDHKYGW